MKNAMSLGFALIALTLCGSASAEQAIENVNVTQIGTYAADTLHYVWLTGASAECSAASPNPGIYTFNEAALGGKSLMATLTTALVNNRKVLVRANGCAITEVYLR